MTKGNHPILELESVQKKVNNYFGCSDDYFIKLMLEMDWALRTQEDFYFSKIDLIFFIKYRNENKKG